MNNSATGIVAFRTEKLASVCGALKVGTKPSMQLQCHITWRRAGDANLVQPLVLRQVLATLCTRNSHDVTLAMTALLSTDLY
jgi:hypothetical protein